MDNITYKIYTLGCKINQYDSAKLGQGLSDAGFISADKDADVTIKHALDTSKLSIYQCRSLYDGYTNIDKCVDIIIVNSCAVTKPAIENSKKLLNRIRRQNPTARLLLIGCWSEAYLKKSKITGVDYIFGAGEIKKIIKRLKNDFNTKSLASKSKIVKMGRSRYFINIQDGCEQYCSYCIVPYTRGKLKSRSQQSIIDEIKEAVKSGHTTVVISGIHLGLYGVDLETQGIKREKKLAKLLRKIKKIDGLRGVQLSSMEITDITDNLISVISEHNPAHAIIYSYLLLPLQSGSDKILKLMNRPYNTKYYISKIAALRKKISNLKISTDVIVGFPGETEHDFQKTVNFIKNNNFHRVIIFPFSPHKLTPAGKMPGQLDNNTIKHRANYLYEQIAGHGAVYSNRKMIL